MKSLIAYLHFRYVFASSKTYLYYIHLHFICHNITFNIWHLVLLYFITKSSKYLVANVSLWELNYKLNHSISYQLLCYSMVESNFISTIDLYCLVFISRFPSFWWYSRSLYIVTFGLTWLALSHFAILENWVRIWCHNRFVPFTKKECI